ncbi:MAG: FliA/WhiG family RNA polymerase sigma factor [Anaerolineaceae bacterium]|nr:FliA/WhiG family RNA polymerase sigma factor [Anaerolineaceae bacterium]
MSENSVNEELLIKEYLQKRDAKLREEIIVNLLPLIHFVLGRLGITKNTSQDYDDLAAQGILGLIEAVDRYDEKYNTKLSTFATLKIRGKILDTLREMDWLSRASRQKVRGLQQATNELEMELKRTPTDEEIAIHLDIDMDEYRKILGEASKSFLSLDEEINDANDGAIDLKEVISDDKQIDPSELIESQDFQDTIIIGIKELSSREQQILSLYYYDELTLKEIGQVMGISESRVSQVHGKAIIKLKQVVGESEHKGKNKYKNPKKPLNLNSAASMI